MNRFAFPPNGYRMTWSPERRPSVGAPRTRLGQALLESPLLSLVTSGVTASAAAFLAWGLGTRQNKWAALWWAVAAAASVKALHDLSRIRT